MNWREEALSERERIAQYEAQEPFNLSITIEGDIPSDCARFTHVHFTSNYEGPSPVELLHGIIRQARGIEQLSIFTPVRWDDIVGLDLSGIQQLTFCLDGRPGEVAIVADSLKCLCVFGRALFTPIELLLQPFPHIDFSGMPHLTSLQLKSFQQVYPDDFMHLRALKRLTITEADLTDLVWLERAEYQLDYLHVTGKLVDCSGVESQEQLRSLILYHTSIRDAKPIEQLSGLQLLDLRGNEIQDEGNLRNLGIPSVLITKKDGSRSKIEMDVRRLVGDAVRRVVSQEKHLDNAPPIFRQYIQRNIERPFLDRVRDVIRQEYATAVERFEQPDFAKHSWLTDEEYEETYTHYAGEYYPFLSPTK